MKQHHSVSGIARALVTATGSLLILLPFFYFLTIGASAADGKSAFVAPAEVAANALDSPHAVDSAAADCSTVTDVPVAECLSLVELYTRTNGTGWITNTHWLQFGSNAPCGWYGVGCSGGHVRTLRLDGNQLNGMLPLSLGNLTELTRLHLENNALFGRIPPTICALTPKLTDLSIAYNALFTLRRSVENCLAPLESDWAATQTNAVDNLRVTEILTDALRLEWTPISYTTDGGYYEIGVATQVNGPNLLLGQTADKLSSSYVVTGLVPGQPYFIRVRTFTPPHGEQPSAVHSTSAETVGVTQALAGRVLVAAYFPADNDLASEIPYVVERMRRGTDYNPNVQVVLLVDARQDGDTKLLEIANGNVMTTNVVMEEWGVDELDTADPAVLAWFLQYARAEFPAERTVVALIGHGIPLAPEIDWPPVPDVAGSGATKVAAGEIPPLPKEHDYSPSDVTNRGYMSAVDVGKALMAATDQGANPFDVIFFDQCFQGSLDVLYEARNSAHTFVASPNYAWLVAAYDRYLARFTPTSTPAQMAQAIIDNYEASLDSHHPNAIFWIRNSDLLAIATQVSILADALALAAEANEHEKIADAVRQSQYVDTTQCGVSNLQLGPPDELIGIESLGAGLQVAFGVGDAYGISTALSTLQTLMANVAKRNIAGNPYLAPEEVWNYGNSLTILAPLPRNSPSSVAWRASIYRSDMPFTATWTVDPTQPVTVTESLAFVRDGHWDEFLAEWYLNPTPTVGQWCQYIPPMLVVMTETETLTLTVSVVNTDSVQLAWTPPDDSSANEYWLYAHDPYAVGWTVASVVPLSESTAALAELVRGDYRYRVVALNDEQTLIAQSNEVTVTITGGITPKFPILLPLIMRD